ncbi:MAG: SMC family ATPase [Actinomycetaceae bacterium]|nr:SMC family ATPase [Actinomycetaceae bacterium]
MLIRHLELNGIGPFAGRHIIDFDALTANGLFLFEGPTGSGKSSIIDAIVFALYGDVAGADSDSARIRSTHAPEDQPSEVRLVFTVASGTYLVTRQPAWNKPKRDGSGTRLISSQATLRKLSEGAVEAQQWDTGENIATGARDVNIELGPILQLNRKQFVQTVVLPQGQFAAFLRLSSTDRSALLETLFDTKKYSDFAAHLAEMAAGRTKQITAARETFNDTVSRWMGNPATSPWHTEINEMRETLIDSSDTQLIERIIAVGDQLEAEAHSTGQRLTDHKNTLDTARAFLKHEEKLASAIAEREELLAEKTELQKNTANIDVMRARIDAHERAQVAVNRLNALAQVKTKLSDTLSNKPSSLTERFEPVTEPFTLSVSTTDKILRSAAAVNTQLTQELQTSNEHIATLRPLVELANGIGPREAQILRDQAELEQLEEKTKQLTTELEEIPDAEKQLTEKLSGEREWEAKTGALTAEQRQLEDRKKLLLEREKALHDHAQAEKNYGEKLDELGGQQQLLLEITDRWIASQAAILAQNLKEDHPCPVCGSTAHPLPAQATDSHTTRATVETQQSVCDAYKKECDKAAQERDRLATVIATLAPQIEGLTHETVDAQLTDVSKNLERAKQAATAVLRLENQLVELSEQRTELHKTIATTSTTATETRAAIKSASDSLRSDKNKLAKAIGDDESITGLGAGESLADLLKAAEEAQTILQEEQNYLSRVVTECTGVIERYSEVEQALSQAKMDELTASAATMSGTELVAARAQVDTFNDALSRINGRLESATLSALTGDEKPQVEQARRAYDAAETAYTQQSQRYALAQEGADNARTVLEEIRKAHSRWSQAQAHAGPVVRLSQLANASPQSGTKVSLQVYVLLRRFEIVVERANEYLAKFSRGRYMLQRADESGGERKTGLGLQIIDHEGSAHTDEIRSPGTLSGGETFYTSLSLALALAEVVQEENGGVRIDTLMLDEGFGTLSTDVLDDVLDCLTDLSASGRKVGIISHVADLKTIIPNRITITPVEGGGSTLSITA